MGVQTICIFVTTCVNAVVKSETKVAVVNHSYLNICSSSFDRSSLSRANNTAKSFTCTFHTNIISLYTVMSIELQKSLGGKISQHKQYYVLVD